MSQVYDPNCNVRDTAQRLVSPRINVSLLPTTISVGTTAVLLPTTSRNNRTFILVQNQSSNPVYLGDGSITTSNGYQLNPFSDITIPCTDQAVIYAIAGSPSNNVSVLEGL